MASIVTYLENFIENTVGLPSDLSRFLNLIKVLDERTTELMEAIKHTSETLCNMQPVATRKGSAEEQVMVTHSNRLTAQVHISLTAVVSTTEDVPVQQLVSTCIAARFFSFLLPSFGFLRVLDMPGLLQ